MFHLRKGDRRNHTHDLGKDQSKTVTQTPLLVWNPAADICITGPSAKIQPFPPMFPGNGGVHTHKQESQQKESKAP